MLGELAELGLMMARELAVRVRESEDTDETVALAAAFQKTSRMVRLTLALDFKLERDAAREAKEAAREAETAAAVPAVPAASTPAAPAEISPAMAAARRIAARKTRVDNLLNRLLWRESEGDEAEYEVLCEDLDARLDEAARSPDFETLPIEILARRMIADMGLAGDLTLSLCEAPAERVEERLLQPPSADTG